MQSPSEDNDPPDPPRKTPPGFLFKLLIPVTFVFVFSCFVVLTHDLLGDQTSAFGKLLARHGTTVLACEAAAAILLAVIAMGFDRSGMPVSAEPEVPSPIASEKEVSDDGYAES